MTPPAPASGTTRNRDAEDRVALTVAICTFKRNEPLRLLLETLQKLAKADADIYRLGVVVVDDSADQQAEGVVANFADKFERGIEYRHSGKRNISIARNLVLETAAEGGAAWIAMTDDDCEPGEAWLRELLRVQREYDADVVTGPLYRRAPDHAPNWLKTQPFLSVTAFQAETGHEMALAFTNNSMISGQLLRERSDLRFDPKFGRIGGEDMVFYRQVAREGYRIVFAKDAKVYENEEADRLTLGYQMRRHYWIGNSSVLTMLKGGSSRGRMAVHSAGVAARAIMRPASRLAKGQSPQILYCAAQLCEAAGKLVGAAGFEVKHK
ncbi:glycosyltransferase [Altererythrobacter aurantiacus]|uniref:Glycosyltransferase n=1 Tax=Parapontixanthobacter aurantiacus TaxID=1463599 RepID=A0A844ZES5_9SPHN|nr:glycosyltransferase [Parapontixanthobacter aurantiacus]MXO85470.1 glycosyltransferase [Parapontixanthobacter aurantiacus]